MTYREIISRIQNDLNSLTKDTYIPRRYILSVFKSKAEFLMTQKFYDKSIYRETNIFKWYSCVTMVEEDTFKCNKIELKRCKSIMKSKKKLPKLLFSRYGSSINLILNIDGSKEYKLITQTDYANMLKRANSDKFLGKFAIIYPDNHLYIPDSNVKKVDILLYTLDEKADDISDCEDNNQENCECYYDREVLISDKIRDVVIQESIKEISMRLQIPKDENSNMDSNIKSQSIN